MIAWLEALQSSTTHSSRNSSKNSALPQNLSEMTETYEVFHVPHQGMVRIQKEENHSHKGDKQIVAHLQFH